MTSSSPLSASVAKPSAPEDADDDEDEGADVSQGIRISRVDGGPSGAAATTGIATREGAGVSQGIRISRDEASGCDCDGDSAPRARFPEKPPPSRTA